MSEADHSHIAKEKSESAKRVFKSKKMPDFAAIHSKQINKMEGIAESLARKKERALYLTTPDGKKSSSQNENKEKELVLDQELSHIEKSESNVGINESKVENEPDSVIAEEKVVEIPPEIEPEPAEAQPDDLMIESEPELASDVVDHVPLVTKTVSVPPVTTVSKPIANVIPQKSLTKLQFKHKIQFAGTRPTKTDGQRTPVYKFAAKSALTAIKQGQDVAVKPVNLTERMKTNAAPSSHSHETSKIELPSHNATKMTLNTKPNREEQHRSMYKANRVCNDTRRTGILKGVRLNKRFELQMAYRNMKKE